MHPLNFNDDSRKYTVVGTNPAIGFNIRKQKLAAIRRHAREAIRAAYLAKNERGA